MESADLIKTWPADNAAAAVVADSGEVVATHGETDKSFALASVTKLCTAYTALIAIEEGVVELETQAGPPGATIRHLLAHASGLAFDAHKIVAEPGTRRLYSTSGFEQLADALSEHSGIPFTEYQNEALFDPLGMRNTVLDGSPGSGAVSTVDDLARFAAELQRPTLVDTTTLSLATTVQFPSLTGVLPGFGHQKPNDWGLGFEISNDKNPHWTGKNNSRQTFGHFGQSGTFLWIDPTAGIATVALTDRDFGPWAAEAWPTFSDAVLAEFTTTSAS